MSQKRQATIIEKIRSCIYGYSFLIVVMTAFGISFMVFKFHLMKQIIDNSTTLAVTGAGVAAFLFTVQSVLISVPKENPFMQYVRKDGRYLVFIHRFCRTAEIGFLLTMIPMFYMEYEKMVLNIVVLSCFLGCLLLTIWSMFLMGKILIVCEKQSVQ